MSATLDRLLAGTRADIDKLRAESADHARDASAVADQMAEPADVLHAMEAEERDLAEKLKLLQGAIGTARNALDAMADERDAHIRRADAAADAAEYYERTTLPHLAAMLADLPPAEALAATGLMVEPPKEVPRDHNGRVIPPPGEIEFVPGPDGTRLQDNGLPMVWSDLCAPGGYVCAVYETAGGPGIDMPDGTRICGMPVESEPCSEHGPDDVPPAPGAVPVATPPVPSEPAGELVARTGPTTTMPDVGLNPRRLDPPPGAGHHSHAKPGAGHHSHAKPGLGSRITGGFKALLDKPEASGEQQQGDGDA